MNTDNYHDNYHLSDANTLVSLPAILARKSSQSLIFPGHGTAPEANAAPKTDKIKMSPMRLVAIQARLRAAAFPVAEQSKDELKTKLSQLFMTTMAWFHNQDEVTMDAQLVRALQRIREASKGLFVDANQIFVDLRLVERSAAGKDDRVANAIQAAEQALLQ